MDLRSGDRISTFGELSLVPGLGQRPRRPPLITTARVCGLFFCLALIWSIAETTAWGQPIVNAGGWRETWAFLRATARPDLNAELVRLAMHSALITLAYAVGGTALSLIIGVVGGVTSSAVWWRICRQEPDNNSRVLRASGPWLATRGVLAVPRAIHEVIWALFLINIVGLDPLVALLAIAIPFGAITAKVFADILDETPHAQLHALRAAGISPLKAIMYSTMPQALPDLLSYAFYRLECAIRSAAVLGIIGAGGLGYQILLSLQSLQYAQMWTFLWTLILLSGLTDFWSGFLRRRLNLVSRIDLNAGRLLRPHGGVRPADVVTKASLLATALLIPWSFWFVQADVSKLVGERALHLFGDVIAASFPPRFDWRLVGELMRLGAQTLSMSILAITFAAVGGFLLSFPAARNVRLPGGLLADAADAPFPGLVATLVFAGARGILLIARAISEPIWAFILLFVLFPGVVPGALALGIYNAGVLGRLMAEVIENMDERVVRALKAQGASGPQLFMYGILPGTAPRSLAYVLYRWEVCIRATVVVGLVGAGGLGRLLMEQLSSFDYRSVTTTLLFFVGLTMLVDLASAVARRAIR